MIGITIACRQGVLDNKLRDLLTSSIGNPYEISQAETTLICMSLSNSQAIEVPTKGTPPAAQTLCRLVFFQAMQRVVPESGRYLRRYAGRQDNCPSQPSDWTVADALQFTL